MELVHSTILVPSFLQQKECVDLKGYRVDFNNFGLKYFFSYVSAHMKYHRLEVKQWKKKVISRHIIMLFKLFFLH